MFRPSYYNIPTIVAEKVQPHEAFVFSVIYWFEKMKDGVCYASNQAIAEALPYETSAKSVGNALKTLEDLGFIERSFADESKKEREEIRCLVDFKVSPTGGGVPSAGGRGTTHRWNGVPSAGGQSNNTEYKDRIEANQKEEETCHFGFPLPDKWKEVNLGFDSDNADEPNVYLKNEWGEKVSQSEIKKRRVTYLASLKSRATKVKHKDPEANEMVDILKTEQELTYLDGGDNVKHALAVKNKFLEHLIRDMYMEPSEAQTHYMANFRAFLGRVKSTSEFHWKNMTNFGYMDRNFNKIIRDLK